MTNQEIKVYLQSPWKFPDSPYYKYLINSPPEGIKFHNIKKQKGVITNKRFFFLSNFLKDNIRNCMRKIGASTPNAHMSPRGDYDLIHCAHCLSKNQNKPWVADIEMMGSLSIPFNNKKTTLNKIAKLLERNNCKKILPWGESIAKELIEAFPTIKDKIEVLHPAIPSITNLNKPKNKKIKIIFAARHFKLKGGLVAVEALRRLHSKYGIEGVVVSEAPKEIQKKYSELKFFGLLPQKEFFKLMESSDIFLYPSPVDTFGFQTLEAMSFGSPPIVLNSNRNFSTGEMVENKYNGYILETDFDHRFEWANDEKVEKIINFLIESCSELIENPILLKKMSKNCIKEISHGKFSIKERNKKLKKIYMEAMK